MKHILAISGGGIRGILPAAVLTAVEGLTGSPAASIFDLIAGTSTGGIIACGLGAGIPAQKMLQMYVQRGPEIFHKPWWRHGAFMPKYSTDGIDKVLSDVFGSTRFSTAKTKLLVPSYDQDDGQPAHFKSWDVDSDLCHFDVCRATSSAPTYFESYQGRYSDGGIFANDPSLNAIAEAKVLWPGEQIQLLHLGTGCQTKGPKCPSSGGASEWLKPILNILMQAPALDVVYMCKAFLGDNYLTVQAELPSWVNEAMDDVSNDNLVNLAHFSNGVAAANASAIATFLRRT